jgi:hypothetical protein
VPAMEHAVREANPVCSPKLAVAVLLAASICTA